MKAEKNNTYSKGELVMSKQYEKNPALPKPVAEALAKDFPGVKVKSYEHIKLIHYSGGKKEYNESILKIVIFNLHKDRLVKKRKTVCWI
jgi:hypothetical protein